MRAATVSFAVIFLAELGDKSQLLALAFATRYRAAPVLTGLLIANALTIAVSVGVGALLGRALPATAVSTAAGVLFLAFAAWTALRTESAEADGGGGGGVVQGRSVVLVVAAAVVLAEFGDKTMFAAMALAARESVLGVWVGATLGMTVAGALAIVVGRVLGARLPQRPLRLGAAATFAVVGIVLLADAVRAA